MELISTLRPEDKKRHRKKKGEIPDEKTENDRYGICNAVSGRNSSDKSSCRRLGTGRKRKLVLSEPGRRKGEGNLDRQLLCG